MKKLTLPIIGMSLLTLVACTGTSDNTSGDGTGSLVDDGQVNETHNVLYRGTLEEAGMSVFMQGTHQLKLDDGRFILLESDDVNLDHYIGQEVEVFGTVRPTTEEGGQIMRVESVMSLEASSSMSSVTSSGAVSSASSEGTPSSAGAASSAQTSDISSAGQASSQTVGEAASSMGTATSAAVWEGSSELDAKAQAMARDSMDMSNWTQQYCSTHIGFCIPVHRNWWYKSFGATSSYLWHVEIGQSEMNNLGEGPISVNLVSGDAASAGLSDGQVSVQGDTAIGVRTWTGNRHFEVRAPASLEAAVRILTEGLKAAQ